MCSLQEVGQKRIEVQRISDRIIILKLKIRNRLLNFVSVYAHQFSLSAVVKKLFFDQLQDVVAKVPDFEILIPIPVGEWNGNVSSFASSFQDAHDGHGVTARVMPGRMAPEFCCCQRPSSRQHPVQEETLSSSHTAQVATTQLYNTLYRKSFSSAVSPGQGMSSTPPCRVLTLRALSRAKTSEFIPLICA